MKKLKNSLIYFFIFTAKLFRFSQFSSTTDQPRFLIVTTTGVGDTLFGTPAIHALRKEYPNSYISVLTTSLSFEILRENPSINEFFILKKTNFFSLIKALRKQRIETAIIFHASQRIIWPLCFFTGASEIIGETNGGNKGLDFILTRKLNRPERMHTIDARLELVSEVGASIDQKAMHFYLTDSNRLAAEKFIQYHQIDRQKHIIGLQPGAKDPHKRWAIDNFVKLGNALVNQHDCQILVSGGPSESKLMQDVASRIKGAVALRTSLRACAALIERMDLFVTNDTGPMHIAFALNTPTVGLFAPTDPLRTGPYQVKLTHTVAKPVTCYPSDTKHIIATRCFEKQCNNPICMDQITVKEVINKANDLLLNSN